MKTIRNSFALLIVVSYIGFSLSAQSSDAVTDNNAARPSTLQTLAQIQKDVVKELDTLFEAKKGIKELEPDLHSNLEQLHETASEIKRQTGKLIKSHKHRTASVWDSMFKEMEKSQKAFGKFFSDVRKNFGTKFASSSYKINEVVSDDGQSYGIVISMPGFNQDQIKVSIEENTKNGRKVNTLRVTAQEEVTKKTKSEPEEGGFITHSSQQAISSKYINGRQQYVKYENGKLEAIIDLPGTVNQEEYMMSFENGILKVEFRNDIENTKTKKLEFKEKKNK